jgi:hypothetical protein
MRVRRVDSGHYSAEFPASLGQKIARALASRLKTGVAISEARQ